VEDDQSYDSDNVKTSRLSVKTERSVVKCCVLSLANTVAVCVRDPARDARTAGRPYTSGEMRCAVWGTP